MNEGPSEGRSRPQEERAAENHAIRRLRPSDDQTQDPYNFCAIGRAWGWRRRMEAGAFSTIQELAEAVGLAERHVSRQFRVASLAP